MNIKFNFKYYPEKLTAHYVQTFNDFKNTFSQNSWQISLKT